MPLACRTFSAPPQAARLLLQVPELQCWACGLSANTPMGLDFMCCKRHAMHGRQHVVCSLLRQVGSGPPRTAGVWEAWASLSSCLLSHRGTRQLLGLSHTKPFSYPVICFHLFTTGCLTWSSELYFLPPVKRFSSFLLQAQGGHNGAIIKIIVNPHQPRSEPSQQTVACGF